MWRLCVIAHVSASVTCTPSGFSTFPAPKGSLCPRCWPRAERTLALPSLGGYSSAGEADRDRRCVWAQLGRHPASPEAGGTRVSPKVTRGPVPLKPPASVALGPCGTSQCPAVGLMLGIQQAGP